MIECQKKPGDMTLYEFNHIADLTALWLDAAGLT
jgi:hypothetical protein